jgi:hypothetical protein
MVKKKPQNKLFSAQTVYGHGVVDNGAKWGSYVTRNPDGSIPFDTRMYKENPQKWQAMMDERMQWLQNPRQGGAFVSGRRAPPTSSSHREDEGVSFCTVDGEHPGVSQQLMTVTKGERSEKQKQYIRPYVVRSSNF